MLNYRHIEYLLALEKYGSFTKAAEALNISQPALSRIVTETEKKLAINFFDRNRVPIVPTEAGNIYLNACKQVTNIEKNAIDEILDIADGRRGTITIAFNSAVSRFVVPIIIPKFKLEFPNVQINVIEKSFFLLEELVSNGTADLAVVLSSTNDKLQFQYITTESMFLAVPPSYANQRGMKSGFNDMFLSMEEIKDKPFILLRMNHGLRRAADRLFNEHNIKPFIFFETDDYFTSQQLTKSDMGFSFTSSCSTISDMGNLSLCKISDYIGQRKLYLCSLKKRHHSRAFTALSDMIADIIKSHNENYFC